MTVAHSSRALLWLYGMEACLFILLFGLYKLPLGAATLASNALLVVALGAVGILVLTVVAFRALRGSARDFHIALVVNIASLSIAFGAAELAVRTIAVKSETGIQVGNAVLPLTWAELMASNRAAHATGAETDKSAFMIYDADLGWTVGKSRRSADGMYFSSAEGIRSPGPDVEYAHSPTSQRVAMVGDSHTFSLEVPFTESWEYHLQEQLGGDVQLLNFGVDGYGVDQMYLRYLRDVRPWHPEVVVVAFIQHDLTRTMAVYPFVSLGWTGMLIKPRFVPRGAGIEVANAPLLTPDAILAVHSIFDLPHLDLDPGYKKAEWEFRFDRSPLTLRLLMAAFPRRDADDSALRQRSLEELNARILAELNAAIEKDGATALFVYIPQINASGRQARAVLRGAGLESIDVAPCLDSIPEAARKVASGIHYNSAGNQAIARCTAPAIAAALKNARVRKQTKTTSH